MAGLSETPSMELGRGSKAVLDRSRAALDKSRNAGMVKTARVFVSPYCCSFPLTG